MTERLYPVKLSFEEISIINDALSFMLGAHSDLEDDTPAARKVQSMSDYFDRLHEVAEDLEPILNG